MRRHAICCSVIDAWPCCCWTMLDASACFILLHRICCWVLDAVPCFLLLHVLCFFMFDATKCFILLPALFYAMLDIAPCFRLLRYLCCCVLDADIWFMLLYAWCCSIHYAAKSLYYVDPSFILLHAVYRSALFSVRCCSMLYAVSRCKEIHASCWFILNTARALCCSIINISPRFMLNALLLHYVLQIWA